MRLKLEEANRVEEVVDWVLGKVREEGMVQAEKKKEKGEEAGHKDVEIDLDEYLLVWRRKLSRAKKWMEEMDGIIGTSNLEG